MSTRSRWLWSLSVSRERPMSKSYTIAEAKNRFPAMVRDAEREGFVEVTRRGRRVARLVSEEEFERRLAERPPLWEVVQRIREAPGFVPYDELSESIERDRTPYSPPNPSR